jgi:hypothetical protein
MSTQTHRFHKIGIRNKDDTSYYVDIEAVSAGGTSQGANKVLSLDLAETNSTLKLHGNLGVSSSGQSGSAWNDLDFTLTADSYVTIPTGNITMADTASSQTFTNKTLTSAVLNNTISGTSIKDEDDMSSDSASHLATQQSIKTYVDSGTITMTNKSMSGANNTFTALPLTALDIDGGTDIGANLADADLLIVDDGAGGTNRKVAMSRVLTYIQNEVTNIVQATHFSSHVAISGNLNVAGTTTTLHSDELIVDDPVITLAGNISMADNLVYDTGILFNRGKSGADHSDSGTALGNAAMIWNELSSDEFQFVYTGVGTAAGTGNVFGINHGNLLATYFAPVRMGKLEISSGSCTVSGADITGATNITGSTSITGTTHAMTASDNFNIDAGSDGNGTLTLDGHTKAVLTSATAVDVYGGTGAVSISSTTVNITANANLLLFADGKFDISGDEASTIKTSDANLSIDAGTATASISAGTISLTTDGTASITASALAITAATTLDGNLNVSDHFEVGSMLNIKPDGNTFSSSTTTFDVDATGVASISAATISLTTNGTATITGQTVNITANDNLTLSADGKFDITGDEPSSIKTNDQDITVNAGAGDIIISASNIPLTGGSTVKISTVTMTITGDIVTAGNVSIANGDDGQSCLQLDQNDADTAVIDVFTQSAGALSASSTLVTPASAGADFISECTEYLKINLNNVVRYLPLYTLT